jgi:aminoglycoside 6'-N-acetyltransferase
MSVSQGSLAKQHWTYQFRPLSAHDLAMVRAWQMSPHVQEWWDDDPITLASVDEPALDQYMVAIDGRPFAYLQCYLQSAYPENGLGVHPAGTRGIDQFIGEPDLVGRGHGPAFIRAFVDRLLAAGVPRAITDPSLANARAIRAYVKAGFRQGHGIDTPDGRALLMIRDNSDDNSIAG